MKNSYCENCDKWLVDPNNENTVVKNCSDCGKQTYHSSVGRMCGFCWEEIDTKHTKSEYNKTKPNWKKVMVLEHEFDEKNQEWIVNHECKVKCQTCEETKPFEDMSTGITFSFGSIPYCDSCAWKGMKEEERQTYEKYANSHIAEEKRIYQRYLKLKNKFSDRSPNKERERAERKLPNWNLIYGI